MLSVQLAAITVETLMQLGALDQQPIQREQAEMFIFKAATLTEQAHILEVVVLFADPFQVEESQVVLKFLQVTRLDLRERPEI